MDKFYNSPCLDLSGVCPGQGPMSVLRSGKDVMPFRQGAVLTSYMGDYIPPNLMPGYLGHLPGVSACFGKTYGAATKDHFQTYRNEVLTHQVRPKFFYGRLPCDFSPFPDVAIAQKVIKWRKLSETPNIRPTNADFNRTCELRKFHERCVDHRDYYLDKTDSLAPDDYFYLGKPYPVRCPVDERIFKIKRFQDSCDGPSFLGPPLRCGAMPCIKQHGMLYPFVTPKLPRPPFQCDAIKPKDPREHEVLLV